MQFYKAVYFNVREKWKGYLPNFLCKSLSTVRVNIYTYCTWSSSSIVFSRDFIICVAYLVLLEKAKACWIDSNVNLQFQKWWDERWGFKVPLITWYYYYNNLMPCVTNYIVLIIILSKTSTLYYFSIVFFSILFYACIQCDLSSDYSSALYVFFGIKLMVLVLWAQSSGTSPYYFCNASFNWNLPFCSMLSF